MSTSTAPQPMSALQAANSKRIARAELHRTVAGLPTDDGLLQIIAWLQTPPGVLQNVVVNDLLCWVRRIGPDRARGICRRAGVDDNRRLGGEFKRVGRVGALPLTDRQRAALAERLVLIIEENIDAERRAGA